MLLEANSGNHVKALSSFSEAVDILKKGNQETLSVNLKKFEFYNGYALCLAGDAKGGDVMLESLKHLSQYSATFKEAMIVNWDSPLIGLLRSRNSAGYTACHNVANLMKIYL